MIGDSRSTTVAVVRYIDASDNGEGPGQAVVIHDIREMYELVVSGKVDPGDVTTHVLPLNQAAHGYEIFDSRFNGFIKVVLSRSSRGQSDVSSAGASVPATIAPIWR